MKGLNGGLDQHACHRQKLTLGLFRHHRPACFDQGLHVGELQHDQNNPSFAQRPCLLVAQLTAWPTNP